MPKLIPINAVFAANQLQRLVNTPFFPHETKDQIELIKAIRTAETEAIVIAAIDEIVEKCEEQVTVAMILRAIASNKPAPHWEPQPEPKYPACRCQGFGIYGGHIGRGQYDGPWKWCDCPFGVARQEREPGLIAQANAAREKLIRLRSKAIKPAPREDARHKAAVDATLENLSGPLDPRKAKPMKSVEATEEIYHGDF